MSKKDRNSVEKLKEVIAKLKKAEEKSLVHSKIITNMLEGVYLIRASDGIIVYTNPTFEKMFGYGHGEMIGKHVSIVNAPTKKDPKKTAKEITAYINKHGVWKGEILNIKKDGTPFWCYASVSIIDHPEHGNVFVSVHTDITEQKKAEEALKMSESKYRLLLENLPQKIFLKDKNSVYISCNENYAKDLKIKPEEIAGKTDFEFYPKKLAEKYRADDKRLMKADKTEDIEEEYIQNGKKVFVHTVKTPIKDEKGNVIGILGIFWDISEQKRAEKEVKKAYEDLKKRTEELEIFQKMTVGRETKMVELKKKIKELESKK